MALPTWPTVPFLPFDPTPDGYTMEVIDELLRTGMDQGPSRSRRRFTQIMHRLRFVLIMTEEQYLLFKGFYAGTLAQGTKDFMMPVFTGTALTSTRVRFEVPYTARDFGISWTKVGLNLLAFNLVV